MKNVNSYRVWLINVICLLLYFTRKVVLYFYCIKVNGDIEWVNDVIELLNIFCGFEIGILVWLKDYFFFCSSLLVNKLIMIMIVFYIFMGENFKKRVLNISICSEKGIFFFFLEVELKILLKKGIMLYLKRLFYNCMNFEYIWEGIVDIGLV